MKYDIIFLFGIVLNTTHIYFIFPMFLQRCSNDRNSFIILYICPILVSFFLLFFPIVLVPFFCAMFSLITDEKYFPCSVFFRPCLFYHNVSCPPSTSFCLLVLRPFCICVLIAADLALVLSLSHHSPLTSLVSTHLLVLFSRFCCCDLSVQIPILLFHICSLLFML